MKAILDNKLRLKKADLSSEQLRSIRMNYEYEADNGEIIQLYTQKEDQLILPPNVEFLKSLGINPEIKDNQVAPYIESPRVAIKLRDNQVEWDAELNRDNYRGLLQCQTGNGKTLYTIWLQQQLNTPLLFLGTKTNYIVTFEKEIKEWGLEEYYVNIDSSWDGTIKPFMSCSVQLLTQNKDVINKLYNKVGICTGDECHLSIGGSKFREALYSLNNKYYIMLSATPEIKEVGFVEAAFSPNIVHGRDSNDVSISVLPIYVTFPDDYAAMGGGGNSKKRAFMTHKDYLKALKDVIDHLVNDRGRQMFIYADLNDVQYSYKKLCDDLNIPSKVNNKDSSKEESDSMLSEFEDEKIKVITTGVSLVEAVSVYHLSVIIDGSQRRCDTLSGRNALIQYIGRLRRSDKKRCPHKKVFIDIIFDCGYENRFINRKKVYESIEGVTVMKPLKSNSLQFRYLLERG